MTASKVSTEVLRRADNGQWLQITPGERFKIRISVEETEGAFAMLEMVADPQNGVPCISTKTRLSISSFWRAHCTSPMGTRHWTLQRGQQSPSERAFLMPGAICRRLPSKC